MLKIAATPPVTTATLVRRRANTAWPRATTRRWRISMSLRTSSWRSTSTLRPRNPKRRALSWLRHNNWRKGSPVEVGQTNSLPTMNWFTWRTSNKLRLTWKNSTWTSGQNHHAKITSLWRGRKTRATQSKRSGANWPTRRRTLSSWFATRKRTKASKNQIPNSALHLPIEISPDGATSSKRSTRLPKRLQAAISSILTLKSCVGIVWSLETRLGVAEARLTWSKNLLK